MKDGSAAGAWNPTTSLDVDRNSEEHAIAQAALHVLFWTKDSMGASYAMQKRQTLYARQHGTPILIFRIGSDREAPIPPWAKGAPVIECADMGEILQAKTRVQKGELKGVVLPPWPHPHGQVEPCPFCSRDCTRKEGMLVHLSQEDAEACKDALVNGGQGEFS